jgi:hypothetical protein
MRNHPSPLSTYLNAGVIVLGILLGIWAKHDQAAGAPAARPAHSADPCCDRMDDAGTLPGSGVSATLT